MRGQGSELVSTTHVHADASKANGAFGKHGGTGNDGDGKVTEWEDLVGEAVWEENDAFLKGVQRRVWDADADADEGVSYVVADDVIQSLFYYVSCCN